MAHPGVKLMTESLEAVTKRLQVALKDEGRVAVGERLQKLVNELLNLVEKVEGDIKTCTGQVIFQFDSDHATVETRQCNSPSIPTKKYCPLHQRLFEIVVVVQE